MSEGIGEIIIKLREEKGYTQEQLCKGICAVSQLAKIELNQNIPDHFLLDRIFGRLGKATERLEYVLPRAVYRLYELQFEIQKEILYRNFEKAEELLEEYESKNQADRAWHRQFIEQERAQILWIRGEKTEKILSHLEHAIVETMPSEKTLEQNMALSVEELKLLLFRWEVCRGTKYHRSQREVWEILDYLEQTAYEGEELVKVYPYVVILLAKNSGKELTYSQEYLTKIAEKALELLRNEAKLLFMPEILGLTAKLLENADTQDDRVAELGEMRKSLLEVEKEFGVHYEKYPLFQHLNCTFELDYKVIRSNRIAGKLSQEKLCEDICTQETMSRIERGKSAPSNKSLTFLLAKMQRYRERVGMNITAEKYEIITLDKEMAVAEHKHDIEKVNALLEELQEKVDMTDIKNRQYMQSEQLRRELREGKYSFEEGLRRLDEVLHMTLPKENMFEYNLTNRESNILNQIASLFCQYNEKEQGIAIWRKLLKNFEKKGIHITFYVRTWELMTGNMAGRMEEMNYGEEPLRICMERLKIGLEIGKGNTIGRSLAIIACVLERKHDVKCISRFRQTLNIYRLMKMEYRYQCIKKHVEKNSSTDRN